MIILETIGVLFLIAFFVAMNPFIAIFIGIIVVIGFAIKYNLLLFIIDIFDSIINFFTG